MKCVDKLEVNGGKQLQKAKAAPIKSRTYNFWGPVKVQRRSRNRNCLDCRKAVGPFYFDGSLKAETPPAEATRREKHRPLGGKNPRGSSAVNGGRLANERPGRKRRF